MAKSRIEGVVTSALYAPNPINLSHGYFATTIAYMMTPKLH
ncbi:MAG: hypothetical protein SNI70_02910 [Rikenellaceae bacterium]